MFDLRLAAFFLYPVQALVVRFLISIEIGEVIFVDEAAQQAPNRNKEGNEDGEQDFNRVKWTQVHNAKHDQTDQLHEREQMNGPGRYSSSVVIHWVQRRVHEPVSQSLDELDALE